MLSTDVFFGVISIFILNSMQIAYISISNRANKGKKSGLKVASFYKFVEISKFWIKFNSKW